MFAILRTDARVFAPADSPPANPSTQIAPLRRHFFVTLEGQEKYTFSDSGFSRNFGYFRFVR